MVYAVILGGGLGTRMGFTKEPKQYLEINKKPILQHTIEKFCISQLIDYLIIVSNKEYLSSTKTVVKNVCGLFKDYNQKIFICEGGENRNSSIYNALIYIKEHFNPNSDDVIITHDAVRPFVNTRIIRDNIKAVEKYGACDTTIKATDTISVSKDEFIVSIPKRSELRLGQTPQSFNWGIGEIVYNKKNKKN